MPLCPRRRLLCLPFLGTMLIPGLWAPAALGASAWSDLPASVRDAVKGELKSQLPQMFPEGDLRDLASIVASNAEDWAEFAGNLHAGRHHEAEQYLAKKAAGWVFEQLKQQLPQGSTARAAFDFISPRSDAARWMAIAAIDPEKTWTDVGQIAWDQARSELKKTIDTRARSYVVNTVNMVLGEGKVLGNTPGDLYLALVSTWAEVIEAEKRRFVQDTENRLYAEYRQARTRDGKASSEEHLRMLATTGRIVRDGEAPAGSTRTYFSGLLAAGVELDDLLELFDRYYATDEGREFDDFYGWFTLAVSDRLESGADSTRAAVSQGVKTGRAALQADVAKVQAAAARKLAELIERKLSDEQKRARAEALAAIEPVIATLHERTTASMRSTCASYESAKAGALALLVAYQDISATDIRIELALDRLERLQTVAEAAGPLNTALADLAKDEAALRTAFEQLPGIAEEACDYARETVDALDKQTARRHLDDTIDAAGRARRRAEPALAAVERLAEKIGSIREEIDKLHSSLGYSRPAALRSAYAELQRELEARDAYDDAKAAFDGAHGRMAAAIATAGKIKASYAERRKAIVTALSPHNVNDALAAAWDRLREVDAAAACLDAIQWDWDFGPEPHDGFGGRAWKERRLPHLFESDADLIRRARAAVADGSGLAEVESLASEHRRLGELLGMAKEMEAELASLDFDVELCLAWAITQYAQKWKDEPDVVTTQPPPTAASSSSSSSGSSGSGAEDGAPGPDNVAYIVKVTGAGWTPHYAGGSYIFEGSNEEIMWVPRDQDPGPLVDAYRDRLDISPCEADIPAWPGMSKRPVIWNSGPRVETVAGPFLDSQELRNRNYANTWHKLDSDGPSLGEIRKRAGCP